MHVSFLDGKVVVDIYKMYLSEMMPNYFRLYSKKSISQRYITPKINSALNFLLRCYS